METVKRRHFGHMNSAGTVSTTALLALILSTGLLSSTKAQDLPERFAIAEFGKPKFGHTLEHWPYVNPAAPKGGNIVLAAFGTFDSLNTYILKGNPPYAALGGTSDALMTASGDDLLGLYGLIAESVEYPEDVSYAIFNLREIARYDDGAPIVAQDFALSFNTIRQHGRPFLRSFYRDVQEVEVLDERRIKFTFKSRNNMKPLMAVAGLAPLPHRYWATRDISQTYLEPPPSSGPYRIAAVDAGRSLTLKRVAHYWGKDLPVNKGQYNFDSIRYDYYRDFNVIFEAFKAGETDFRSESSSKRWATEYNFPAFTAGKVKRATPPSERPEGMQGLAINTRREAFSDVRVRAGLAELFDFEWTRKSLLYDQYTRTASFFPNSDYGSSGPLTAQERAILEPFAQQLPEAVFEGPFKPSKTDGSGRIRKQLRTALRLFKAAGWTLDKGKLRNAGGEQMRVEILLVQPDFERLMSPYVDNLKRAGINASMRIVDTAQYEVRVDNFDFDMVSLKSNFFPPPGPELRSYYGSKAADLKGSANWSGIRDTTVDALVEKIITAKDLKTLKQHTRALDRVLLFGHYMIPQWHNTVYRIAYWDRFGHPAQKPKYALDFPHTWWIDAERDAALAK